MSHAQFLAYVRSNRWALSPDHYSALVTALEQSTAASPQAVLQGRSDATRASRMAIVTLHGFILERGDIFAELFGLPSHHGFAAMMRSAADDESVREIIVDLSSPGGIVSGVDTSVEAMLYAVSKKPVTVAVSGVACSAAYWIASQANRIVAAPTALVGNIGIIAEHHDISEAEQKAGVKTTILTTGKFKSLMNPSEPLSEEAKDRFMVEMQEAYSVFISTVAAGRGISVDEAHERWGDGAFYTGQRALESGLVDEIGTLQSVMDGMTKPLATRKGRRASMDMEQLKAEHPELYAQIIAQGKAEGKTEAQTQAAANQSGSDLEKEVVRLRATVEAQQEETRAEKRKNIAANALEAADLPKQGKVGDLDLDASFRAHVEGLSLGAASDDEAKTRVDAAIAERRALIGEKKGDDKKRRAFLPSGDTSREERPQPQGDEVARARRSIGL
jgi:signal peptide peptidase SppA